MHTQTHTLSLSLPNSLTLSVCELLSAGSIRFKAELDIKHNGGLYKAIVILEKIKVKYDNISWADLIQMAGALAVELSGGPVIDMVYGRKDCEESCEAYAVKVTGLH